MPDIPTIQFDLDGAHGARIRSALRRMTAEGFEEAMHEFANTKISRMVRGFTYGRKSEPGEPPGVRSGQLRNSLTYLLLARVLTIGTNMLYAAILHFGGTIRPRNARALTIPISPEAEGHRARDFADTFIIRPRPGADPKSVGVIARRGPGGEVQPLFALRTSVTVAARPWLFWDDADGDKLLRILQQTWERGRAPQ